MNEPTKKSERKKKTYKKSKGGSKGLAFSKKINELGLEGGGGENRKKKKKKKKKKTPQKKEHANFKNGNYKGG